MYMYTSICPLHCLLSTCGATQYQLFVFIYLGKIIQIVAYDDSNGEKVGSQSIVTDHVAQPQAKEVGTAQAEMSSTGSCSAVDSGEEPGQSEQQVQQSSPAVESQNEECGEHEQHPEKSSTDSGPANESHDQDDAGCDDNGDNRDSGKGSGDDGTEWQR